MYNHKQKKKIVCPRCGRPTRVQVTLNETHLWHLLRERELEPSFERRYKLTERIVRLNKIIASSSAALHDMMEYDHG